jgi:hypothetical protein
MKHIIAEVLDYPTSPVHDRESYMFGAMLDNLGITYSEEVEDYRHVGNLHTFKFDANETQFETIRNFQGCSLSVKRVLKNGDCLIILRYDGR